MSERKVLRGYVAVATVIKELHETGMSQQAIENVLRFYGVNV